MIADELNKLIQTKADIKQALIDKGQNPTDEFATYSDNIRSIQAGGNEGLSEIGWNLAEQSYLKDAIEYAKEIQKNPKSTYQSDKQLVIFPKVDELELKGGMFQASNLALFPEDVKLYGSLDSVFKDSNIISIDLSKAENITNAAMAFENCYNLTTIKTNKDFLSGVSDVTSTFRNCTKLKSIDYFNASSSSSFYQTFQNCKALTSLPTIVIGSKCTNFHYVFDGCLYLPSITIEGDISNVQSTVSTFSNCSSLKYLTLPDRFPITSNGAFFGCASLIRINGSIVYLAETDSTSSKWLWGLSSNTVTRYTVVKDIGIKGSRTYLNTERSQVWGIANEEVPDAKQSLTDSLITYSFDRAAAGYSAMTIKLYSKVKNILTEDEIAQITDKGFTIA